LLAGGKDTRRAGSLATGEGVGEGVQGVAAGTLGTGGYDTDRIGLDDAVGCAGLTLVQQPRRQLRPRRRLARRGRRGAAAVQLPLRLRYRGFL
jgi:hypothetical protein